MSKMLTPMELYHAARETCVRLYVANGGEKRDRWEIKPYPGTAAISRNRDPYSGVSVWTLCMPSFPMDIRLPRWKADLIAAYTVHELLHALWTDFSVTRQARQEHLHSLVNALEDNRIEAKAHTPALVMVTEAHRLLEALNDHIARRALGSPQFALDDPKQFSFVLNLVLFREKLGYVSPFPANWRALVRAEWLPMFDLALDRFESLRCTQDVLQLTRDLKALAASLPKPVKVNPPRVNPENIVRGDGKGDQDLPPMPLPSRDAEITEPAPESDEPESDEPESDEPESDEPESDEPELFEADDDSDPTEDAEKPGDGQEAGGASIPTPGLESPPTGDGKPSEGDGETETEASDGANEMGGRGGAPRVDEPAEDLTDATQEYSEAHLDDLAAEAAKDAGKSEYQVQTEAHHVATVLNVPLPRDLEITKGGDPKLATARIDSPAKLRRHLTMAVKSPERVSSERRQVSGRLDMRNLVGLATGAQNVFKRRVEEEGREAAVSILIDISGSMAGAPIAAAKAMCLHMGDALKAAGVKFEISGFDDAYLVRPKSFAEGWAEPTRRKVAGIKTQNGTGMLPAMKACAERLLKQGNVTRRILLVLTDGQDSYAAEANAALCAFYQGRGVEIVGIGLMTYVDRPFRGRACFVRSASDLSRDGLKMLVKALDAGAPRVA
jgi:Mg-chelatase subunit ChlD